MVRNCTNKIKATCAEVSVRCNVSNEVSRICVQTVASRLYDHQFYLTKEEAIEKDPLLKEYRGTIERKPPKIARTSRLSLPEATKLLPHSTALQMTGSHMSMYSQVQELKLILNRI